MHTRLRLWAAGALAAALGCASGRSAVRAQARRAASDDLHQPAKPGEQVSAFDFAHSGRPDVWEYTVADKDAQGHPTRRLVRKEIDLNGDGRADLVRWYGPDGELTRDALDLDFDGKVDEVNEYRHGALARKIRSLQGGKPDSWLYYEDGKLVREEEDRDRDGRVDTWETWKDGKLVRTGRDTNGDGKPDAWSPQPVPASAP